MRLTKYFAAAAALSLAAAPALADPAPSAATSLSHTSRVGGHAKHANGLFGGGIIIAIIAASAIIIGIVIVADNSSSN